MCTYTMESIVDPCDSADTLDLDPDWLSKYMETENVFLDYLKSLTFTSPSNVDMADSVLPEYDGSESGFEALDNLCELLVSLCDSATLNRHESIDSTSTLLSHQDAKKIEPRNKRSLKCLSSHYGKELQVTDPIPHPHPHPTSLSNRLHAGLKSAKLYAFQVKPNRARSHSSVGVDEILKTHDLAEIASSESRRKSRRVSLGMRPKFSNWSKVKGAFKRDKSTGRADSRDDYTDVVCYSGDEIGEKIDPHSSSSHENTGQLSSSEEEFEFYTDGFFNEAGIAYQIEDLSGLRSEGSDYGTNGTPEHTLMKSRSAMLQPHSHNLKLSYGPNVNSPSHKNPFKWYRTKSITPTSMENGIQEAVSTPPSPFKSSRFLYDEESLSKINDDASDITNPDEALQEVQNKYESLQKRLSREFCEKYHDWRKIREGATDEDDKTLLDFDASKLAPYLEERNLTPGFKQKFQEWQKLKGLSLSPTRTKINKNENPNTLKKSKSDWHKWRPGSKSESNVLRFLDKDQQGNKPNPPEKKELAWLEKELQKVAREKQRLEKEKEKYAERENRLQNMKRAIKSGRKRKQEVVVPTSTGLYRFQGISSKFTRKLYEWEKAKGITAESSTFALLDPYYSGPKIQRNVKPQINDTIASLSRSRSVGSVDVAGVGTSILQSASVNHQQSSLSLNDMEQLEEAHLQVENDNLMRSTGQLFDNDDEKELDLYTNDSLDIPEFNKNHDISRNIPKLSSSNNPLHDSDLICATNYSKQVRDDRKLSDGYGTDSENLFCGYSGDTLYEMSSDKQKRDRDSANADAESIVNQIKKLRAGTSVDDADRINTLTNLQHLADQLLDMVRIMNNKKNENVDDLASSIADLAVELKREIKNLTSDELQAEKQKQKKISNSGGGGVFFYPEDAYTDTEGNENDSPTVHCTFTLPSWRVKHTTPSSTESESSNTRNRYSYADAKPSKNDRDRHRKHYKEDNSSGGDENYDAGDETTVYLDLRGGNINKKEPVADVACVGGSGIGNRRESSDNISTSNSESFLGGGGGSRQNRNLDEALDHEQEVLYCSLTLDGHKGNEEIKTNYSREKRGSAGVCEQPKITYEGGGELDKSFNSDNEDETFKTEVRSYSPKPLSSKRKCTSCGKIKRISKSRKSTNTYCPCGKKEPAKVDSTGTKNNKKALAESSSSTSQFLEPVDSNVAKSASYSNTEDLCVATNRKLGKISRSKVYDFKSLTDIDKSSSASAGETNTSPVNVIVPTTRKIFAPLKQDENGGACAVVSYTVDECSNDDTGQAVKVDRKDRDPKFIAPPWISDRAQSASPSTGRKDTKVENDTDELNSRQRKKPILEMHASVNKLPPASPLTTRRNLSKEGGSSNSSIRLMIAHYNKLMSEKPERRASEGNCWSPSLQKSPVLERRYRFEHLKAESDNNIRKSKSAVLSDKSAKPTGSSLSSADNSANCISKSSSAGSIHFMPVTTATNSAKQPVRPKVDVKAEEPKINAPLAENYSANESHNSQISILSTPSSISPLERNSSFESVVSETKLRNLRLQEAKNKFFNEYPTKITIEYLPKREFPPQPGATAKETTDEQNTSVKDELGQATVKEAESSNFNLLLNKSVSTGAIDDRTRTCNLPICEKSPSKSKFGFSSIASRFRKVKMRRHKDPEMSAVSSLCKASLLVNLNKDGKPKEYFHSSKSCPSSPVMQRSASKRNSSSN